MARLPIASPPLPAAGQRARWHSLPGLATPAALFDALRRDKRFALVIAGNANEAREWAEGLRFFAEGEPEPFTITQFPDREILPYDHFSPHPDIISERLRTLYELQSTDCGICLVSAATVLSRLCPRDYVNRDTLLVQVGERCVIEQIQRQMAAAGYQHRETVFEHGEFAVRGALFDIFPMGSEQPFRIELFDNEVESIRQFDPETQRSLGRIDHITVLPASEVNLDDQAINRFRDNWHLEFSHDPSQCPIYRETIEGISSAGIESYLPMFYDTTESLLDYLPDSALVISTPTLEKQLHGFLGDVQDRYDSQSIDPTRPLMRVDRLYAPVEEFFQQMRQFACITVASAVVEQEDASKADTARGLYSLAAGPNPHLLIDGHDDQPLQKLKRLVAGDLAGVSQEADSDALQASIRHTLFCVESAGRREVFLERLHAADIAATAVDHWPAFDTQMMGWNAADAPLVGVAIAAFNRGASFPDAALRIVAEPELFGVSIKPQAASQRDRALSPEATIHSLIELRIGAPIVHIDHGVGRYRGLEHLQIDGFDAEFMTLEYAGGDRIYVPVTSLHLINRYIGGDEVTAPLHKLGGEQWRHSKERALKNVRDVAAELLDLYARRALRSGFSYQLPADDYATFCAAFPFEETPDQRNAIEAVLHDMQAETPMDRLVCGDVGFGKTEVAMRAAFVAACNSKQVMVLVPTTLLAQQHGQNFGDRFADWPVRVETLSRFKTAREQDNTMQAFADGNIDILVGTHKLLQSSLQVHDLGLVIVDEEHRFGVRQKEKLKNLCTNVDLLTMTATPIPRTLNMAMAGIRDLSIIATPPARRLSVKTFVNEKQPSLIKEAMLRELLRGGQVFYLHNDVATIDKAAADIAELVPDARIAIGHGQMRERELEQVMSDFYHKRFNVLVCSTIIETGIDIPNANTIIIERADRFGLAQLHQLRGRVGRSHHQAYAYLFIPNRKLLTKDAEKRLDAIEESQDLGAGFILATHDLEIRGAGELLGDEQSGQMHTVGFTLYLDMLDEAVNALREGKTPNLEQPLEILGEINLHIPALIPDDYLPDVHNRLLMYKRIANTDSAEALRDLQVEMIDRFGLLTTEINHLFAITALKQRCAALGIQKVDAGADSGYIEFGADTQVDPMSIVELVQQRPAEFKLVGATRLSFNADMATAGDRLERVEQLLDTLAAGGAAKE